MGKEKGSAIMARIANITDKKKVLHMLKLKTHASTVNDKCNARTHFMATIPNI